MRWISSDHQSRVGDRTHSHVPDSTVPSRSARWIALSTAVAAALWPDQGTPWVIFVLEKVLYSVDVSEYVRQRGQ